MLQRRLIEISQLFKMGHHIWRSELEDPGGPFEGYMSSLEEGEAFMVIWVAEHPEAVPGIRVDDPPTIWSFGDLTDAPPGLLELIPLPNPAEWQELVKQMCGTFRPSVLLGFAYLAFLKFKAAELAAIVDNDDGATAEARPKDATQQCQQFLFCSQQHSDWERELISRMGSDYSQLCHDARMALMQSEFLLAGGALCPEPSQILGNVAIAYENQLKQGILTPFADELIRLGEKFYPNIGSKCLVHNGAERTTSVWER